MAGILDPQWRGEGGGCMCGWVCDRHLACMGIDHNPGPFRVSKTPDSTPAPTASEGRALSLSLPRPRTVRPIRVDRRGFRVMANLLLRRWAFMVCPVFTHPILRQPFDPSHGRWLSEGGDHLPPPPRGPAPQLAGGQPATFPPDPGTLRSSFT